jgi:hypothetical protein
VFWWISLSVGLLALGCNATCLRDSDCMGASICTDNRCLLIVHSGSDAGSSGTTSADRETPVTTPSDAGVESQNDAGSVN